MIEQRDAGPPPRRGRFVGAGRRTNAWLRWVLIGSFLTGWLSFAAGGGLPATLTQIAHAVFGLGVIVLAPWKTALVRRVRRTRPTGVILVVLVVLCLVGGFWQLAVGWRPVAGISAIQIHVGAALIGAVLLIWHVVRHRRQRLRRSDASRRALLRGTTALAGVGVGYVVLTAIAQVTGGRNRRPTATGSRAIETEQIPATSWLFDTIEDLDPGTHRLVVAGSSYSVADLTARAGSVTARLDCTSGWYADAEWSGVRLSALIDADLLASARSLTVTSVTGYTRSFPVAQADALWLAVARGGVPMTRGTGAPVRLVAPGRRGFWWVKWVASVELSSTPSWLQLPFPPQ